MGILQHWRNLSAHAYPTQFDMPSARLAMSTAVHLLETVLAVWLHGEANKP
jgi:hypothetical protein